MSTLNRKKYEKKKRKEAANTFVTREKRVDEMKEDKCKKDKYNEDKALNYFFFK